jgi:metal-responsive CopG/Arc/MetJ family transcriptional regulator
MAKILISVDEKLLARIDRAARALGLSRSAYLARLAAREALAPNGPGRAPAARRAIRRIEELFATNGHEEDMTEAVRRERDSQ